MIYGSPVPAFATDNERRSQAATTLIHKHNLATPYPHSRPNYERQYPWDTTQQGMGMSERYDRLAREREEIAARVADFKATQEKFKREREEYFTTTLKNGRDGQGSRHALGLTPAWP